MPPLTDMYYCNGESVSPMPYWASSYISFGEAISIPDDGKFRLIVGLAVPIKAYVAALTAMGIVISRAKIPFDNDNIGESEYLAQLTMLNPGMPVHYRNGADWYTAEFVNVEMSGLGPCVHLIWKRGKQECKVILPIKEAQRRLRVVDSANGVKIDLSERTIAREITYNREFLEILIGRDKANEYSMKTRLECIIVGCVNTFRQEIKETEISVGPKRITGTIQDLLRTRKFLAEGSSYRSNIVAVNRKQELITSKMAPYTVIFNGAASFLKWRDNWRKSHWVVLLDKTESCFQEAAEQLNSEYIARRAGDVSIENLPMLPKGVEMLAFHENPE